MSHRVHGPEPGVVYGATPDSFPEHCRWCGVRTEVVRVRDDNPNLEDHKCPHCKVEYTVEWEESPEDCEFCGETLWDGGVYHSCDAIDSDDSRVDECA